MLASCPSCDGFVPASATTCPHCGAAVSAAPPPSGIGGKILAAAGTGLVAITLMACYGGGPVEDCVDKDDDGFYGNAGLCGAGTEEDCDDDDPDVHPDADDPDGDGIDQNCDGEDGVASAPTTSAGTTGPSTTTSG